MSPRVIRGGRATGRLRGGIESDDPMTRECPKCGAKPGWRCVAKRKWSDAPMKNVHPERKGKV